MRTFGRGIVYLLLFLIACLTAGPFVWTLLTALKGSEDIFAFPPRFWPEQPTLKNFLEVWQIVPFGQYLLNSVIVSLTTVISTVLLSSLAAYPLERLRFPGKNFIFVAILGTMMVPEQVVMIPVYRILLRMNLLNTLVGIVLPTSVNAFGIFLMRQFYKSIPRDLDEAALIDGCSHIRIWWNILLPISRPAVATLAVFTFVASWSNFLWPLVVLRDTANYTLPVGLNALISAFSADYKYLAAGAILSILPVLAVFVFMQRYFIKGILAGSVKG